MENRFVTGILIGLVIGGFLGYVLFAQKQKGNVAPASTDAASMPASQATFAASNLIDLGAKAATGQATLSDTGYQTIMTGSIKTPESKDLVANVSLQCGLLTDTTVRSKNGSVDTAAAKGNISVRLKATNSNTGQVRYFVPSERATYQGAPYGVTFCSRLQQMEAQFSGLNCTTDLLTGVVTCADPEKMRLLMQTMNANSFNFAMPGTSSGVWNLEVQARAVSSVSLGGDASLGSASAEALIGVGSMHIQVDRFIKDLTIGPVDLQ